MLGPFWRINDEELKRELKEKLSKYTYQEVRTTTCCDILITALCELYTIAIYNHKREEILESVNCPKDKSLTYIIITPKYFLELDCFVSILEEDLNDFGDLF